MPVRRCITLALLAALAGCTIEGSVGDDGRREGGTGSGTDAAESSGSDVATSDTSGLDSAGGTGGGTGGAGSTGMSGTGDGTAPRDTEPSDTMPPSDVPLECHPLPDEPACARCRKVNCCGALTECLAHDTCLCWWDCRHLGGSVEECGAQCQSDGLLFMELAACVESSCDCQL